MILRGEALRNVCIHRFGRISWFLFAIAVVLLAVTVLPRTALAAAQPADGAGPEVSNQNYVIGPGDGLQVFVWRNPDLTISVPVRPDGKISIPLVEDLVCAGKTPTQLAREIEERLKKFVMDPIVTVIVSGFIGPYTQQVRIVGEAARPQALPYRANMSLLDAMIAVGGLTQFAAGNRAKLVRGTGSQQTSTTIRIEALLRDGEISANTALQPGDIIIIPQSFF
jgi:polysaccharide biosynthesis/export protein